MPRAPKMSKPVTHAELRVELEALELRINERNDKHLESSNERNDRNFQRSDERLELSIQRSDKNFELLHERMDKEFELSNERMDKKLELSNERTDRNLGLWGGALRAEMHEFRAELRAEFASFVTAVERAISVSHATLSSELARHVSAILEASRREVTVVDEKYSDLPARVLRLEQKVKP